MAGLGRHPVRRKRGIMPPSRSIRARCFGANAADRKEFAARRQGRMTATNNPPDTIGRDGPPRMVKRPTGSGGEPSSPNCESSAGVKARHLFLSADNTARRKRHPKKQKTRTKPGFQKQPDSGRDSRLNFKPCGDAASGTEWFWPWVGQRAWAPTDRLG